MPWMYKKVIQLFTKVAELANIFIKKHIRKMVCEPWSKSCCLYFTSFAYFQRWLSFV